MVRTRYDRTMTTATKHPYIVRNDEILNAETISSRLPHLSNAQVFDALSYYSDNQAEINEFIEANRVPEDKIDPRVRF